MHANNRLQRRYKFINKVIQWAWSVCILKNFFFPLTFSAINNSNESWYTTKSWNLVLFSIILLLKAFYLFSYFNKGHTFDYLLKIKLDTILWHTVLYVSHRLRRSNKNMEYIMKVYSVVMCLKTKPVYIYYMLWNYFLGIFDRNGRKLRGLTCA